MHRYFRIIAVILMVVFISGCEDKFQIVDDIPDAENILFTPDGRLFVTGGDNIFEILESENGGFTKTALCSETGNFTGMAYYDSHLYTLCTKFDFVPENLNIAELFLSPEKIVQQLYGIFTTKLLLRANLTEQPLEFETIHTFEDMLIPNGMVVDGDGRLYISDETFLPTGKIVRLSLSEENDELPLVTQESWLTPSESCYSPNGMAIDGDTIYFTDFTIGSLKPTHVKKVKINSDGSPGEVTTLYSRLSFFDDLTTGEIDGMSGVVVADFVKGTLLFIEDKEDGVKLHHESERGLYSSPSSVIFGTGPMFDSDTLLVTEKGIMFDLYTSIGNKLSGQYIE